MLLDCTLLGVSFIFAMRVIELPRREPTPVDKSRDSRCPKENRKTDTLNKTLESIY
jgi:hypothetical protein